MGNGPAANPSPAIKVGTAVETGCRDNAEGKTCDADIEELAVPPPLERRRPATLRGLAPSGRGMDGRCGGSGFVAWVRGIPENPDDDGAAGKLKIVVRAGAGYDNIDLKTCEAKGVTAMNTPGQNANAVAELVFGMMIVSARGNFDGNSGFEISGREMAFYGFR